MYKASPKCTWTMSPAVNLAGMDGNRTHPGRLSSAPQTVLKTAELTCGDVHRRPRTFRLLAYESARFHYPPQPSAPLAVFLAVTGQVQ